MIRPATKEACRLMHDGSLAHAEMEAAGMMIDVPRLDKTIDDVSGRIDRLTEELKDGEEWRKWRKKFGRKASIGSRPQLGELVYGVLGYEPSSHTSGGKGGKKKPKTDEEELAKIDLPFIQGWLEVEKLKKLLGTYLKGVRREVVDGYLRPSFNLHLVRTFRPSSDNPNFQNIPIRDKEIGKLIRSCFVPRDGRVLVEVDYSALEFKVAACFWQDEAMVEYASDPDKDIHRDMAAECYMLDKDEVTGSTRFFAKNQFVFPTLYGSYYVNTARNLWNVIGSADLRRPDGQSLEDHLMMACGIGRLGRCDPQREPEEGTFERHVREVERRFHARFPQWAKRKGQWQKKYNERGWFRMMTGFVCSGIMSRNNLYNYPIQGPAFHLLLWSLIRTVKELKERRMKSLVIGQIHDSMLADVPEDELDDYLEIVVRIMTVEVRRHWDWVVTPLSIEAEVGRENWWEKEKVEI